MLIDILKTYLKPYGRFITLIVLFQFIGTIAALVLPSLNADIIDNGVVTGDTDYIIRVGAIMLGFAFTQAVFTILAAYFGARTAMGFGMNLRSALFRRIGEFSSREMSRFGAPSLITRTTNDVTQIQMLLATSFTLLVGAPIMMVGGIFMAMREDVGLSWLVAVAVPILAGIAALVIWKLVPLFQKMQKYLDTVNRVLREQATGIRVLRAFTREDFETERFAKANAELTDVSLKAGRWFAAVFPLVMLLMNLTTVAVLWFGAHRIDAGQMEIGAMTAYLTYLIQILMSVMMATMAFIMVPRASVSADRVGAVLETESTVTPPDHGVMDVARHGELSFKEVQFRYPGASHSVLESVSFSAVAGETTAIIGSTGAGKTTLINLIPRLFDTTGGSVEIDGVNVRELDPEFLWTKVGLVPQQPYLFSGTVASNLRYGRPEATDDELWAALEVAQATEFVEEMPDGLDSDISQGGTNVSGGQRQRLSIARALVREPEIYVFDDSFSALDLATDARLRRALKPVTGEATVVIVAQRVSTIQDADRIIVLDDGEIVGIGTHDELLGSCPTYVEIVESQRMAEVS